MWRELRSRLDGELHLPGDPGYHRARQVFFARYDDVLPSAVVRCRTPHDVVQAVGAATRAGLPAVARAGGHSLAGFSVGPGVVIDVSPMNRVDFTADGIVRVGAGTRAGRLNRFLTAAGRMLPVGTDTRVGVAGLTLGGGLGMAGRRFGFTCDHLVAADVVLADGRWVTCDRERHPDLFWALRGGGSFGVVTSLSFAVRPAMALSAFRLRWPFSAAEAVINAWQQWIRDLPTEFMTFLALRDEGEPILELYGSALATEPDAAMRTVAPLAAAIGLHPTIEALWPMSFRDSIAFWDGTRDRHGWRATKSECFTKPIPADALVAQFTHARHPAQNRSVELIQLGGAYNALPAQASAYAHRTQSFTIKHSVEVPTQAPPTEKTSAQNWLNHSWASVRPHGTRTVYPNFTDPDLPSWPTEYHGANYPKLQHIKAHYDPTNLFAAPQSIRLPNPPRPPQ
ncbi:FAD-binding oxidoreductase [Catenulispora acidiphila]|uniref:FAD-binding oxidoreductase n=1 Tax=Catenulispora acidiphila TaxID=304895 RepID=UPI0002FF5175|nr:FAD-binding oxidoreductase [Catenulispora acidiphila]